ncbi:hypothetical protein QCA50_008352 [Cerrena zonata]|uniref:ribonuclease H n=1 Tax=Cerrena zonata TaxID=2478898 RepID=A0AAW0GFU3_9APHY
MVKSTPNAFYAVARGRNPGVYRTWDDCEEQVADVKGARYKKFSSEAEAVVYVEKYNGGNSKPSSSAHPQASTGTSGASSSKQQKPYREGWLTVYCDGASKNNGKPNAVAGVGVWWGKDDDRNIAERCPGAQTNNRAELIALIRALETTPFRQMPLLVRTDSKYTIKCFTEWIRSWRAQGWMNSKGQPVKNRDVISYADALLEKRKSVGQKVSRRYGFYRPIFLAELRSKGRTRLRAWTQRARG